MEVSEKYIGASSIERIYFLNYMETSKLILIDLTSEFITKFLLDDLYKISSDFGVEKLYVTISLSAQKKNDILRNLLVYGFQRAKTEKFTTNKDILILKIYVNQEYDFVDLV